MMKIPFNRRIAELYSKEIPFVEVMPKWKQKYRDLMRQIEEEGTK